MNCYFCKKTLADETKIGRQDRCPYCGMDVHICKNCQFYDVNAYNECREPQADRVVDKESANFCEYFVMGVDHAGAPATDPALETKKKLEALFKK